MPEPYPFRSERDLRPTDPHYVDFRCGLFNQVAYRPPECTDRRVISAITEQHLDEQAHELYDLERWVDKALEETEDFKREVRAEKLAEVPIELVEALSETISRKSAELDGEVQRVEREVLAFTEPPTLTDVGERIEAVLIRQDIRKLLLEMSECTRLSEIARTALAGDFSLMHAAVEVPAMFTGTANMRLIRQHVASARSPALDETLALKLRTRDAYLALASLSHANAQQQLRKLEDFGVRATLVDFGKFKRSKKADKDAARIEAEPVMRVA